MCIFSCLALKSLEYSVAYENLQPSTVAYKRVAYEKKCIITKLQHMKKFGNHQRLSNMLSQIHVRKNLIMLRADMIQNLFINPSLELKMHVTNY